MSSSLAAQATPPRTVQGGVNYLGVMRERPRFHANDHSRDNLLLDPRTVCIEDARTVVPSPTLAREGFVLVAHESEVRDFRDADRLARVHPAEIQALVLELSGAHQVVVNGTGVLRFGERSPESGRLNNSRPARFIHIDVSNSAGAAFAERSRPGGTEGVRRFAHYNIWRTFSGAPQDVPLAVCDARTLRAEDLVPADAVFDVVGRPEWSFEGLLVRYSSRHRWCYYADMSPEEVLVFKTHDSDPNEPSQVPHSAFDDASCPPGVPPRASLEMRAIAYWLE